MSPRPRISLCIPTHNRAECLRKALESGLREVASLPPGTAEILVCNNASVDEGATEALLAELSEKHPELRVLRNQENIGFDLNYLRVVEEASGEFVWVLGNDDIWLPGSVARVLQELELGTDACLCLAYACDLEMTPKHILPWYLGDDPPLVWDLQTRKDLIRYFDACARNAGAFAFISVAIFRRDRFLAHKEAMLEAARQSLGYIQVWGMMEFLREPTVLRYIPEVLIHNRMDPEAGTSHRYYRLMFDLKGWSVIADRVFGDDPELWRAFSTIVGRNHHDTMLQGLRLHAESEAKWEEAKPYLARAGFSWARIAAVEYAYQTLLKERTPSPHLEARSLCFADLAMVMRGARRIVVLAMSNLEDLTLGGSLLEALKAAGRPLLILTTPELVPHLAGFEVQAIDAHRYLQDVPYREGEAERLVIFNPDLVVNLDRERGLWGDDLVSALRPPGALGFRLPERGYDAQLVKLLNENYHCMLPGDAPPEALLEILEL